MRSRRTVSTTLLMALALAAAIAIDEPKRVLASTPPIASFTWIPCRTCLVAGELFLFDASSSYSSAPITAYIWNWGDGTTTTTTNPTTVHQYLSGIAFYGINVMLTVNSTGQQGTVVQLIMFQTLPVFTFRPQVPGIGQPVTFNATGSKSYDTSNPIQGYQWNFGDGTTGSGIIATHNYSIPGTFRTSLSLVTPDGMPTASETIPVSGQPPSQILQTTFHSVNITAIGTFSLGTANKTIAGTVSVRIVNATTGAPIFSKTYNVNVAFDSMGRAAFVLAAPTSFATVGISCTANTHATISCMVSQNPDVNTDGRVDIIDVATVSFAFGSTPGTPRWNPAADLDLNGIVDIIDAAIVAYDFGATSYY